MTTSRTLAEPASQIPQRGGRWFARLARVGQGGDPRLIYGVVGGLFVLLWAVILGFSTLQKQRLLEEGARELVQLRAAVSSHTESLFRSVESDLRVIDQWLQANPQIDPLHDARFNALVEDLRRASGGLIDPRMVSSRGQLHYLPAKDGVPLADVSDRAYYTEPLRQVTRQLYIGDPVLSRVTGKWGIPVSWRLERPVGGMQVVFAAIELDRLMAFHEQFRAQPTGTVLLLRTDGMVLSRTPFDAKAVGHSISAQPGFNTLLQRSDGAFTIDSPVDGVRRLVSHQRLGDYPLVVLVSRGVDDTLQSFYQRRLLIVIAVGVLSLVALLFTRRMVASQRALAQAKAAHQRAAAELAAAQDASPLGLFRCGLDGRLSYVNDAWRRIFGLPPDRSPDDWITLVRSAVREQVAALWRQATREAKPFDGVRRLRRPDGSTALISFRCAPIVVEGLLAGHVGTVEDITERAASEKAQRMLTAVFEATSDVVLQSDPQGRLIYMNPAARRLAGLAPDASLAGHAVGEFLPSWVMALREREIEPTALAQGVWLGESAVYDAQHREIPMSHMHIAHRGAQGQVEHFSAILRDISQLKQAERALRDSEARQRAIADNAPGLIAEFDTEPRFLYANRAYLDWAGLDPQQMVGRRIVDVLGEVVYAQIGPYCEQALKGNYVSYERQLDTPQGPRWIHVSFVPRFDELGGVSGFYSLATDITPRRDAEEATRQSEQRLRSVTDHLPMRVAYVDRDERYRFVNLKYERAYDQPREALIGRSVREVHGEAAYRDAEPYIHRALAGETVSYERELVTRKGYRCYRTIYVPQLAEDERTVLGFIAIIHNTTGQKLEERRLLELSQQDSLTGLLNRAGFERGLREAIERSRSTQSLMALMYLDIDHFKQINDHHGHLIGDMLLRGFAGRLAKTLRANDVVARIGGDEFTIVVEGLARADDAARLAQNIVAAMQAPFSLEALSVSATTSIGIVLYQGGSAVSDKDLVQRADELLYLAKGEGRNRYRIGVLEPGSIDAAAEG